MPQRRTIFISPAFTIVDDGPVVATPQDTLSLDLGGLLNRVSAVMVHDGTLLLDDEMTQKLRLPAKLGDQLTRGLDDAIACGWKSSSPFEGWITFYAAGRPTVNVGIWPIIRGIRNEDPKRYPIISEWGFLDTVPTLSKWRESTGRAWRTTPGIVGLELMRETFPKFKVDGKPKGPTVRPKEAGPSGAIERAILASDWKRECAETFEHGYDCRRMYLNAAGTCEVLAPWTLKPTGKRDFDPKLAGWWEVHLSPWQHDKMPDPAGPGRHRTRWITTPTANLLTKLTDDGVYGGFEVLSSWTGQGKRLLRKWTETIEGTYQKAATIVEQEDEDGILTAEAQDAGRIMKAAKAVYAEGWGLLNRPTSSIYRPDWHFAILAHARCELWRKMWDIGNTEGRWPHRIDTDNAYYGSDLEDAEEACPKGFKLADKLGHFKDKVSRRAK